MKKILIIVIAGILCFSFVQAKTHLPRKFRKQLTENGLQFTLPDSFKKVKVHKNPDFSYDFAIKHVSKKLEIRYSIIPLAELAKSYRKSLTDTSIHMINPNASFANTLLLVSTYNIGDSILSDIKSFDSSAMKREFGADWGGFAYVIPRKTFAPDYKYCLIMAIHKDNIADGYITFLFDNIEDVSHQLYYTSFDNMTFKTLDDQKYQLN